jgi:hypothetical protein
MPTPSIEAARAEQLQCAAYLIENGWHAGAALGLHDWYAEEFLLEQDEFRKQKAASHG